jgi:outer membrane protein, heavy metal efflux system
VSQRWVVPLGVALALTASRASAQAPLTRLTLEAAAAAAAESNPTVRAKEHELRAVRAGEITAGLRPNPVSTFAAEQLGARGVDPQYTVSVGQPIETGGKRDHRLASARASTRVTLQELADVRRQIVAQVKKAFTDALVARDTLALAQDNLRTLDEVERIQRFRAERGDLSELELTRLQVQRFAFERDALDAAQALEAARIAVRTTVGPDAVREDFELVGDLDVREVRLAHGELRRRALDNRPDLRAARASVDRARADVNLARANAWWDFTPQIEYQRIGPDNTIGFGISVPIRLFDRNQGEIERTRAELQRTDALREAAALQVLADVDTAVAVVRVQQDRVRLLRDTYVPKARFARDTVEYAYRRGGLSLLDYLDAQRTYRETAVEHLRALGNLRGALYQLEAAVGGPWED